jgi:pyruvate/2-oxoglutarate dehydrogenase complex dihydrolipoamide dehydrogenase (E3) component
MTRIVDADVLVVGMGVGGEAVAGALAVAGLDVVGIEAELVGGECPYWACIPSKMMLRAGNLLADDGAHRNSPVLLSEIPHPGLLPE